MKTAIIVRADSTHEVIDIQDDTLAKLQTAVDGLIEAIDLTDSLTMWVNEEFLFRGSFEPNLLGTAMYQSMGGGSTILGDVVFTGGTDPEGYTMGLNDSDYHTISELVSNARRWVLTGEMN